MLPRRLRSCAQPQLIKPCKGCERLCHWTEPKKLMPVIATPRLDTGKLSVNPHNYIVVCHKQLLSRDPLGLPELTKEGRGMFARTFLYLQSIEPHRETLLDDEFRKWHRAFPPSPFEISRNRAIYKDTGTWNRFVEKI